jgi:hypothetical protein
VERHQGLVDAEALVSLLHIFALLQWISYSYDSFYLILIHIDSFIKISVSVCNMRPPVFKFNLCIYS